MKVSHYEGNAVAMIALGNLDAWLADAAAGAGDSDLAKNIRDVREESELDEAWKRFQEDCAATAAGGRSDNHQPRLRTEHVDTDEHVWEPGDPDVDRGLSKRFTGRDDPTTGPPNTTRTIGDWVYQYDAAGTVRRCYHKNTDPRIFDRV